MYLSVVVPCYNECENIERGVLDQMTDFLASQPYASELIVSDDGSTDDSLGLVQEFAVGHPTMRVLANAHAGKPFALRSAPGSCTGRHCPSDGHGSVCPAERSNEASALL